MPNKPKLMSADDALAAWFDCDGRGLPWVDRQMAQQYAVACCAHGIPFTRDDTTQGSPIEWRAWANIDTLPWER